MAAGELLPLFVSLALVLVFLSCYPLVVGDDNLSGCLCLQGSQVFKGRDLASTAGAKRVCTTLKVTNQLSGSDAGSQPHSSISKAQALN